MGCFGCLLTEFAFSGHWGLLGKYLDLCGPKVDQKSVDLVIFLGI